MFSLVTICWQDIKKTYVFASSINWCNFHGRHHCNFYENSKCAQKFEKQFHYQEFILCIYFPQNNIHCSNIGAEYSFKKNLKLLLLLLLFLATLHGLQDLRSPTRDRNWPLPVKAPSPNHWTAREFPKNYLCKVEY